MPVYTIVLLVLMAIMVGVTIWWSKKSMGQAHKNIEPSYHVFFEATGYRVKGLLSAPTAQSAQITALAWINYLKHLSPDLELHFERGFQDIFIDHYMSLKTSGNQTSGSIGWYTTLSTPPAALMHICDKDLGSLKKALGSMFSKVDLHFQREYDGRVQTGDTAFDKRFAVYTPHPQEALRILATPGLKEAMLALPSVDLRVMPESIEFVDIEQKNIASVMNMPKVKWVLPYVYYMVPQQQPVHEMVSEVIHRMWVANRAH